MTESLWRCICHDYLLKTYGGSLYYHQRSSEVGDVFTVEVMTKTGRVWGEGPTVHDANWQLLDRLGGVR